MKAEKIETVTLAKGIAILLVVAGHFSIAEEPAWWSVTRDVIYRFHMPLFFLLSGYLFGIGEGPSTPYAKLLKKKAGRLILPLVSITVLFLAVKNLSQLFVDLQFPPTFGSFLKVFYNPMESFIPLLWFIYALFIIFVLHPLLSRLFRRQSIVLVFSIIVSFIRFPEMFTLSHVFHNLPLFTAGVLLGEKLDLDRISTLSGIVAIFIAASVFIPVYVYRGSMAGLPGGGPVLRLIFAFSGSTFVIASVSILSRANNILKPTLSRAGLYSMSIYLLHTNFVSGTRITFFQVLGFDKEWFIPVLLAAILLGAIAPALIEKYVLRRYYYTRWLILGLSRR